MKLPDPSRIPNVSPLWWGAIASGAAAGAILFPEHRVLGGVIAGSALLVLALYKTPCCAGCGGHKTTTPSTTTTPTTDMSAFVGNGYAAAPAPVTSSAPCGGGR